MLAEEELPDVQDEIDVHRDREIASERLSKNAETQAVRFNKIRADNLVYSVGDTVFLRPGDSRRAKLEDKYVGPFRIMQNFTK